MTERKSGVTETYVVQRAWERRPGDVEWIDYRNQTQGLGEAQELLTLLTQTSFTGPFRIIHRVTAVVETVVD